MSRILATNRVALKENYIVREGTVLDEFETGWASDNGLDTTVNNSQDYFKSGTGSVKFTVGAGRANGSFTKTINQRITSGVYSIWVYIVDPSKLGSTGLGFFISSTTDFSKYFTCTFPASGLHKGWNKLQINQSKFAATGGEVWDNTMVRLRIRLYADGTNACTAYFDRWNMSEYSKPKIMIQFDDCFQSAFDEGYAYMQDRGLKGTFFVINTAIGAVSYMTLANLNTVYSNGWDLGTHGLDDLTTLPDQATMESDVATNRNYLINNGFTRASMHYAYPSGSFNNTVESAISNQGMVTGRSVQIRVQSLEPDERLRLNSVSIANTTTLATAKGYIDNAIAAGGMYTIAFHQLVATADALNKWVISDFQALIDYILLKKRQGLLDVVTVSEWYNGLSV